MRTRSAFVSNSSSSSFILDFEKENVTRQDLEDMLLPDSNIYHGPYHGSHSKSEVLDFIQDDLKQISKEDVVERLSNNWEIHEKIFKFPNYYEIQKDPMKNYCRKTFVTKDNIILNMSWWDYRSYLQKQYARKFYKNRLDKLKHPYFIEVHDNSSLGSDIEHGNLFNSVLIERISNH